MKRAKLFKIDPRTAFFCLRVGRSRIHRRGVFACETIPARRKVIEYTGELISRREALRRLRGPHHQFIFRLNRRQAIDGRIGGSGAQFINHCCEPNLYSSRVRGHILLMSRKRIKTGEELTIDYHFSPIARIVRCRCGAAKCRGTLNLKPRRKR